MVFVIPSSLLLQLDLEMDTYI